MHDILFVPRAFGYSRKVRVMDYLPYLDLAGVSYQVVHPPARFIRHAYQWVPFIFRVLTWGRKSRVIFVQKDILWPTLWAYLQRCGCKIVYDFDDAIFAAPESGKRAVYCFSLSRKSSEVQVGEMIRRSDLTIVANDYLAQFARKHGARVCVFPMSVKLSDYRPKQHGPRRPVIVGWHGSPFTVPHLALVKDALQQIARRYGEAVEFVFMTNGVVPRLDLPYRQIPLTQENEIAALADFDVGIVPLPESPFSLGKCSFKLIQYLAAGQPTVSARLGFNAEVIRDGENGFLAGDSREWYDKLSRLIEDAGLRQRFGEEGRRTAAQKFDIAINSQAWVKLIREYLPS
jgi:glycosyltransferase involved in cell wall biosynthesis